MPVAAVIAGGAIIGKSIIGSNAAKNAAKAQVTAANAATAEQQRQYDLTRSDYAPYLGAGTNALAQMQALNKGDFSSFNASPDYEFARSEGLRGVQQSAAARGGAFSGNALRGMADYSSGLASQQYNSYYGKLQSLAGQGQNATNSVASAGQNRVNATNNNLIGAGDARASGIVGAANAQMNGLRDMSKLYAQYN
jgi:hypothetical protein